MQKKVRKIGFLVVILTTSAIVFTACNKKNEKTETLEIDSDSIILVEELPEVKDYNIYSFEQKELVVSDAKKELAKINQNIDELKAEINDKTQEITDEAKAEKESAIKELEKIRDDFKSKIKDVEKSTADTWDTVKKDITSAYGSTFKSADEVYSKVKSITINSIDKVKDTVTDGLDSLKEKVK